MRKELPAMAERIFGLLLAAIGALWIHDGWRLGDEREYQFFDELGPDRYLILLGVILAATGVALVLGLVRSDAPEQDSAPFHLWPPSTAVTFTGALLVYAALLDVAGYTLATFLFCLIAFALAGRSWRSTLAGSLLTTAGSWLVFVRLAGMPLPRGFVGF
jgi:hypothetical protein